ncbi:MAG: Slp family lipoprotein [Deferrisomatales bacterium]
MWRTRKTRTPFGGGSPPSRKLLCLFGALLWVGCAGAPLDTSRVDPSLLPGEVVAAPARAAGRTVQWGGLVVQTTNRVGETDLEILAYPLARGGEPRTGRPPLGRFVARRDGYLDPAEYAPGRAVTVVGAVLGTLQGRVGEAEYTYGLVAAEQLHLWPPGRLSREPRVQFGIGAIFSR